MNRARAIVLPAIVACAAFGAGCPRSGLQELGETWFDDEGREVVVTKNDDETEWVATWVEQQFCPNGGAPRPPERFRLRLADDGSAFGTLGICRHGFEKCPNGPAIAEYRAQVTPSRIEGTVHDRYCGDYVGSEVFRKLDCEGRPPSDYLESSPRLSWQEDSSGAEDHGRIIYRGTTDDVTLQVWAISSGSGQVSRVEATSVEIEAADGRLIYAFDPASEVLVEVGDPISARQRLALLKFVLVGETPTYELTLHGLTLGAEPTDPHCIRGSGGAALMERKPAEP